MWKGQNGFDSRNDLVLGGVRIGIGCMNLVTTISRYTQVPVTLMGLHQVLSSMQQIINEFRHALRIHHVSSLGELQESACKEILSWKNEGGARTMATTAIQNCNSLGTQLDCLGRVGVTMSLLRV